MDQSGDKLGLTLRATLIFKNWSENSTKIGLN